MAWRPHARAEVDPQAPQAWASCQRCGINTNLFKLSFQQQWAGQSLVNLNLLVCDRCTDKPSPFLRTLVLPPDPPPVFSARPEPYSIDETDYRVLEDGTTVRETEDGQNQRITEENTQTIPDSDN